MAKTYYKNVDVTGVASSTVFDEKIESTDVEKRRVKSVLVCLSGWAGNFVEIFVDNERIAKIIDYLLPTYESTGSTNTQKNTDRMKEIYLDYELEVGQELKVGITCGATNKDLKGCYVYEIV